MGLRIFSQRAGKGNIQYRAPSKGKLAPTHYPGITDMKLQKGKVMRLLHERGRGAPLAQIQFEDGPLIYIPAVVGLTLGSTIEMGEEAKPISGNILPLKNIGEGNRICNIEMICGDGGKLVKSSGNSATLLGYRNNGTMVRLPSGKSSQFGTECRATIGEIAGGGKGERPFLKAGTKHHSMKAKGRPYPRVRGVAQSAARHPFGGGRHQHSFAESRTTSRNAPPGRKVGSIAARQTGPRRQRRNRGR